VLNLKPSGVNSVGPKGARLGRWAGECKTVSNRMMLGEKGGDERKGKMLWAKSPNFGGPLGAWHKKGNHLGLSTLSPKCQVQMVGKKERVFRPEKKSKGTAPPGRERRPNACMKLAVIETECDWFLNESSWVFG